MIANVLMSLAGMATGGLMIFVACLAPDIYSTLMCLLISACFFIGGGIWAAMAVKGYF